MRVAIVTKINCKSCINIARIIISVLPRDWDIVYEKSLARAIKKPGLDIDKINADIIIVIGGDGTILRTAQFAHGNILGINVGGLGFLSEIEIGNIEASILKLIRNEYTIIEYMGLDVYVNGNYAGRAINDAVIHTDKVSKIRKFKLYENNYFIETTSADGVIVATPIGSTSYSFSAGGPILMPNLNGIVVSYIAPVGFRSRSIVFSEKTDLKIVIVGERSLLTIDGQIEKKLGKNDVVNIRVSENGAKFISMYTNFYEKLREKLIKDVVN